MRKSVSLGRRWCLPASSVFTELLPRTMGCSCSELLDSEDLTLYGMCIISSIPTPTPTPDFSL